MISADYIRWFQSSGTLGLLVSIFLSAKIPLEVEGCFLAPCYLRSPSWPCPSSPSIIGGRSWQALRPSRFLTGCWLLPKGKMGSLRHSIFKPWRARLTSPPPSIPLPPAWVPYPSFSAATVLPPPSLAHTPTIL